ncbi:MAG TPA: cytochrome c biogenesis protein CcdA [Acidimicrobiales bacterium]|nr:cytochrome c biogenesis protein CcdA [Acidimicrobiales bacterium]
MNGAPLALALAAGMVAAVNPCGFSLLPAYEASFVSGDDRNASFELRMSRAVGSAMAMTAGFVTVFIAVETVVERIADRVREQLPWITIVVGVLLVVAGGAAIAGRNVSMVLPGRKRAVKGTGLVAMTGYGAVNATASLSCTIGPFLAITATATDRSVVAGLATYFAYGFGMGIIILVIATTAALSVRGPTLGLKRLSRYAGRVGGVFMVLGGLYAIWYARWELGVYQGRLRSDAIIDFGERLRLEFVQLVDAIGAPRLAAVATLVIGTMMLVAWLRRESPRSSKGAPR